MIGRSKVRVRLHWDGHLSKREMGWESPNSDEGAYTMVLFICTYFVINSIKLPVKDDFSFLLSLYIFGPWVYVCIC